MRPLQQLQSYLAEQKLAAFLVLTKINRQYLSGFTGSAGALLINAPSLPLVGGGMRGGAVLYVDDRYTIRAKRESNLPVRALTGLATSPALRAPSPRQGREKLKIAIEDRITLREFLKLEEKYPRVRFEVTSNVVENLRAVKSPSELRAIEQGSKIIDAIFRQAVKILKKNNIPSPLSPPTGGEGKGGGRRGGAGELREVDIALEIARLAKNLGASGLAFDPIVAFGANAASPHHFSGNRKIGKNNFLLLDFGVLVRGYHSDFTRTLFIGKPNKKQAKIYNIVREAQDRAIKTIATPLTKEGVIANAVDKAARDYISKNGFGKYFTHNTGHGVGLEIHELPNFSPDSTDILEKNMIVTVEPGIYIEGWGGVRIEDMVLVGKESQVFSKIGKELKEMIIN